MNTKSLVSFLAIGLSFSPGLRAESDMDDKIEEAAESSYNYRSVLEDRVDVDADNGVVTLTGTVNDSDHKRLAEDTVANLPGVVRVENKIAVEAEPKPRSDEWIALKARGRLLVKANVSATDTDVRVVNGVVTLTGTANDIAQKELTEAYVKDIEGVKSVDNQIQVISDEDRRNERQGRDADARDRENDAYADRDHRPTDRTMGDVIDDASITAQIKYALVANRATSAMKTSIDTKDGEVTVRGEAASEAEKALVTHLIKGVRGVQDVDNQMTIRR